MSDPNTKITWKKMFKKCPFCSDDYFLAGPRGGLSQNFKCRKCGAIFNHTPFGIELLEKGNCESSLPGV